MRLHRDLRLLANHNGDRGRVTGPGRVTDLVGEGVRPDETCVRRVGDLTGRIDRGTSIGRTTDHPDCGRVQVTVNVRIVGRDIDGDRRIPRRAGTVVVGLGSIVDRRHRDGDDGRVTGAGRVADPVGEGIRPGEARVRRVSDLTGCIDRGASIGRTTDHHDRRRVQVAVNVRVVGRDIDGDRTARSRADLVIIGLGGIVDRRHRDSDDGRVTSAGRVANPVGEGVRPGEARVRRVSDLTGRIDGTASIGRTTDHRDRRRVQVAVNVRVVGRDIDGDRTARSRAGLVIIGLGSIVDRRHRDGDDGRVTGAGRVANLIGEGIRPGETRFRRVGDLTGRIDRGGPIGRTANHPDCGRVQVAVNVRVVGRDIDGDRSPRSRAGLVIIGLGSIVDRFSRGRRVCGRRGRGISCCCRGRRIGCRRRRRIHRRCRGWRIGGRHRARGRVGRRLCGNGIGR